MTVHDGVGNAEATVVGRKIVEEAHHAGASREPVGEWVERRRVARAKAVTCEIRHDARFASEPRLEGLRVVLIGEARRREREDPDAYGPFAYSATNLVMDAIEKTGPDRKKMKEVLNATKGTKERVASRLERIEARYGRRILRGTGVLATIGATAPFVGLFGTVWGIMNSFIGISKAHTTNLAVVAPGIAEALLATALGLLAAIPAVVIYNLFARSITGTL